MVEFSGIVGVAGTMAATEEPDRCGDDLFLPPDAVVGSMGGRVIISPPPTGRGARGKQIWWAMVALYQGAVPDTVSASERDQAIRNKIASQFGELKDSDATFRRHVQRELNKHCNPVKQRKPK
jgi:hypothetical protein